MKIALAQLDYHIGNFSDNTEKIIKNIKKAGEDNADLIVFSELAISGYPAMNLLTKKEYIDKCLAEIKKITAVCTDIAVIIGCPSINTKKKGKPLFNSAYFIHERMVKKLIHKTQLADYDFFDETNYFEANKEFELIEFKGKKIGLCIGEDLWDKDFFESIFPRQKAKGLNPVKKLCSLNPDLLINITASPFSQHLISQKKNMLLSTASLNRIPLIYLNQVGGQTECIFEGGSLAINKNGEIIRHLKYFSEDIQIVDVENLKEEQPEKSVFLTPDRINMIHDALITGIKGYFQKLNFKKAVLGLSGGLDSAVVLVLAARALGKENVHSLLLPSQFSSEHSIKDSVKLSENLGTSYDLIDIRNAYNTLTDSLKPVFSNLPDDISEENIQSRIRGLLLMAYSNKFGNILLNTSNKSEAATGYGTLYGDMAGSLAVLGDLYKTEVYELAGFINKEKIIIPENIIHKVPSAELRPNQKDSDSLPEYSILDKVLYEYIELGKSEKELIERGYQKSVIDKIIHLLSSSEYKRYQSAPILRVTYSAFGNNRKIPLSAKHT